MNPSHSNSEFEPVLPRRRELALKEEEALRAADREIAMLSTMIETNRTVLRNGWEELQKLTRDLEELNARVAEQQARMPDAETHRKSNIAAAA